jgi:hypothetical protein
MAHESEGEQRAEYGMGAVSMGYDPGDWSAAYDGYRCADDPEYAEAQRLIRIDRASRPAPPVTPVSSDDIPF